MWGTSTGFVTLDELTGGYHKGEVFTLGARTSHGKSAFATQSLFKIAMNEGIRESEGEQGKVNVLFSPEMSAREILLRQLAVWTKIPTKRIKTGEATEFELEVWREAVGVMRLLDPFIQVHAQQAPSITEIIDHIERLHATSPRPLGVVMIDYLQFLSSGMSGGEGYEHTSAIIREIRNCANRLDIPIVLLSQLNRKAATATEDDPPQLHELEGSGKIEARSDTVALLHRPIQDVVDSTLPQRARVDIVKNRNGEVGTLLFWYYPAYTWFEDKLDGGSLNVKNIGKGSSPVLSHDEGSTWAGRVEQSEGSLRTESSASFEDVLEEIVPYDTQE